jgi:hypothetical protein
LWDVNIYQLEAEKNDRQEISSSLKVGVLFTALPGFTLME